MRIGTEGEDDTGCIDVGVPDGAHYVQNEIDAEFATGDCRWGTVLTPEEGAEIMVTDVFAYGYDNGATAPAERPGGDAKFGRESICEHPPILPAGIIVSPESLTEECYDVAVGNSDNSDFKWVARAGIYDDLYTEACMQDCNGGMGCSDLCNSGVPPACDGTYYLLQPDAPYSCLDYGPVGIDVQGNNVGTDGAESATAEGSSGSGEFMLFPSSVGDYDGNGVFHARLIPIQLSGTGRPTRSAHLTAISSITIPSGASLYLLHEGTNSFKWTHNDNLVNASSIATAITGAVTLPGSPPKAPGVFVAKGIPASALDELRVTMSWTIGTNTGPTPPQGWSFELQDIGCSTYVQAFTIRRLVSPERVTIEPYGAPGEGLTFPATPQSWGASFDFTMVGLHVVGELRNMSSQGATLVLSTLTYHNSNVCSTGTLSLDPE